MPATSRTLTINGESTSLAASTLAEALIEAGYVEGRFATALNGTFVPQTARAETPIKDGDAIEVVTARQGG